MQRSVAVVIGVLVIVLAAVAAFVLLSGTDDSAPPASAAPSSPAPSAAAEPSLNAELLDRPWTVLFIGLDHNAQREAAGEPINADAIMLVNLNADASRLSLASVPRDTVDIPLPDGSTWERKINAIYSEQGPEGLASAVEGLTGVPVDAYLALDMDDFTALVDAVGGVEVSPEQPLVDPIVDLDMPAGPQHIDAATANAYVRTRVDQDYGRMARQQEVLLGIAEGLVDRETDVDVRALVQSFDSLLTDLPMEELPTLLELVRRASDAEVRQILIEPPLITFEGDRGDGLGYVLEPDVEAIRQAVGEAIGE